MHITSPENAKVKLAKSLQQRKQRQQHRACLAIGEKAITEARHAGLTLQHLFFREDVLTPNAFAEGTPWATLPPSLLKQIAETDSPPPVIAILHTPATAEIHDLEQLFQPTPNKKAQTLLVLDGVQDPGNLGTLLRSAVAFGIQQVLLIEPCADAWQPKVIRASTGLQFRLALQSIRHHETPAVLAALQNAGWHIFLADAATSPATLLHQQSADKFSTPHAIVLGQEGQGLRLSPEEKAPFQTLSIAMVDEAESLNVAVSGSILLHHLYMLKRRQREGEADA